MQEKITISEAVAALLDKAKAENQPMPTLRGLRAQIGGGSLTTSSEAVKKWRLNDLQETEELPSGFDEKTSAEIADVVWKAVLPVLQEQIKGIRKNAAEQIETERSEAQKLKAAAAEALAVSSAMDAEFDALKEIEQGLRETLAKTKGELTELRKTLEATNKELASVRKERDRALAEVAAMHAEKSAMEKLMSMLDPKYLKAQSKSK